MPIENRTNFGKRSSNLIAELLLQNSSSSPRSLVTPADFMQIFIFATRWHRDAMLSGSENGKMLKYAGVKYRSAEYITPLHLRPVEVEIEMKQIHKKQKKTR